MSIICNMANSRKINRNVGDKNSLLNTIIILMCIIIIFLVLLISKFQSLSFVHNLVDYFKNRSMQNDVIATISNVISENEINEDDINIDNLDYFVKNKIKNENTKSDTLTFIGDICINKRIQDRYDAKGIDGIVDEKYINIFKSSDFVMGNLEGPITENITDEAEKTFVFFTPPKYIKILKDIGISLLTLANNHILDYGENGGKDTIKFLDEEKVSHIGLGDNISEAAKPKLKIINGRIYAFYTVSSVLPSDRWKAKDDRFGVSNGYDLTTITSSIEKIRSKVDKIIVYIHWGKELENVSIDSQKNQAKILINSGVDLIIGSHPHVVEEIEYYNDVPIVYSLGDFIYGGTTKNTMAVSVIFDYADNEYGDVYLKIYPGVSNYEKVVSDWEGTAKYTKYAELQNKCSTCFILKNGYVVSVNQFANIMDASSSNTYTFDEKKYKSEVLKNVFNNWSW